MRFFLGAIKHGYLFEAGLKGKPKEEAEWGSFGLVRLFGAIKRLIGLGFPVVSLFNQPKADLNKTHSV